MTNVHLVFITADVDCDGTFYAAHRVSVPAHRAVELASTDALRDYMRGTDIPFYNYVADAIQVLPMAAFLREHGWAMSSWSRGYFHESGYTSLQGLNRVNPWVYDDTIGIPALDSRYDDIEANWGEVW